MVSHDFGVLWFSRLVCKSLKRSEWKAIGRGQHATWTYGRILAQMTFRCLEGDSPEIAIVVTRLAHRGANEAVSHCSSPDVQQESRSIRVHGRSAGSKRRHGAELRPWPSCADHAPYVGGRQSVPGPWPAEARRSFASPTATSSTSLPVTRASTRRAAAWARLPSSTAVTLSIARRPGVDHYSSHCQ
jgi:hypothetical protein